MPHFPKPVEGSWTEHYPHLSTEPASYYDSITPEYYDLERKAIFEKAWLNLGRVEQLPKVGSYFTKEIDAAGTSIIVVRSARDEYKAFHNICRHRGNKLVWNDYPGEETSGVCRNFTCKYHGWRFALDGELNFVQQEEEFFGLNKSDYPLASVQIDTWEGWLFVNLDPRNTTPLREYMGALGKGLEGYPFEKLTQVHKYRAEIGSNWKLFIDAFTEFYHAPVLHVRQAVAEESQKLSKYGYEALHYELDGPHGVVSSWGGMSPPKDLSMVKPVERVLRSGLFGPWDAPDIGLDEPLPSQNLAHSPAWGLDSVQIWPNFVILIWQPGWYLTYHYWPTSYNTHVFDGTLFFTPSTTPRERLAREYAAVTFKEYGLQDGNTLEATQIMLESRVVDRFPLNDQEILCRHLHQVAAEWVEAYQKEQAR